VNGANERVRQMEGKGIGKVPRKKKSETIEPAQASHLHGIMNLSETNCFKIFSHRKYFPVILRTRNRESMRPGYTEINQISRKNSFLHFPFFDMSSEILRVTESVPQNLQKSLHKKLNPKSNKKQRLGRGLIGRKFFKSRTMRNWFHSLHSFIFNAVKEIMRRWNPRYIIDK